MLTKANHIPQEVFLDDKIARIDAEKAQLTQRRQSIFPIVFTEQTYTAEKCVEHQTTVIDSIHFSQAEVKEVMSNLDVHKAKSQTT